MRKYLLFVFVVSAFASCHRRQNENTPSDKFCIPVIVYNGAGDSIKPMSIDSICGAYPTVIGKYKFTKELDLNKRWGWRDTTMHKDFVEEYSYHKFKERDSITTDGFQIFADYNTTIRFSGDDYMGQGVFYPVYLVNETKRTKLFIGKDGSAFAVQEAKDTVTYHEDWYAIEYKGFDFCGNGYFGLKVHPGEFVMLLAAKYAGPDTAQMRIRIKVGEHIYISQPFKGSFSFKQFRAGDNISNSHSYSNVWYRYHGALPKNEKEIAP